MLAAVNNERRKAGLPDLKLNAKLVAAAQGHSGWQSVHGMGHSGENGSDPSKRCQDQGYGPCAENVALGQQSTPEVMVSWMNSQGHRDNILNVQYTEMGSVRVGDAWTQNFGFGEQRDSYNTANDGSYNTNNGMPAIASPVYSQTPAFSTYF